MTVDEMRAVIARFFGVCVLSFALILTAPQVLAQQPDDADDEDTTEVEDDTAEEIVVTGSRLKRNTFSSVAPL